MNFSQRHSKLFYKLVRSSCSANTKVNNVNNILYSEPLEILEQWHKHFQQLATPPPDINNDLTREQLSKIQNEAIVEIELSKGTTIKPISETEVGIIIKSLNSGKAMDANGISAEHLKYAGDELAATLSNIFNKLLQNLDITQPMKEGILTPILKMGKDKTIPSNYRGITVAKTFSKVFEAVVKSRITSKIHYREGLRQEHKKPLTR
ncbi:uncharacterized protein LOC117336543 [Pecten maximus]|uniref:uncharacterized protein LOC117336543 n=1 Tax=Pecten maximus TaxID=6579 RepID=UPI001458AE64|nr:uncharacterized protein LOC117336543 [Pecten maximus]